MPVQYLKRAQTGFPADSDARLVAAAASLPLVGGPHAAELDSTLSVAGGPGSGRSSSGSSSSRDKHIGESSLAKTLYAWAQPISPHLAVETEGRAVSDDQLIADVAAELRAFAADAAAGGSTGTNRRLAIVETAGGVASPGPSGTLQASKWSCNRLLRACCWAM
jgi:dethiobiotin synthetase/adenosylmethionine--8-amino-7-oxononanoate aminotransferase